MIFENHALGRECCVRLSQNVAGVATLDCVQLKLAEGVILLDKQVYSGNITAIFEVKKIPNFLTLCPGSHFSIKEDWGGESLIKIEANKLSLETDIRNIHELSKDADVLGQAKIIVVVGAGVKSEADLQIVKEFTDAVGGQIAGTRPLVMNGLLPIEYLVGMSGKILTPKICIVIGASGASPFTMGIKEAKTIIAINKDREAPIFKISDFGIVGNFKEVLAECIKNLKEI